jgi:hypothetical protein
MNVLTVLLGIWAMVALCAVLFIRGASPRVARPAKTKRAQASRYSLVE